MEIATLVIVQRMALDASFFDKFLDILACPVQQWQVLAHFIFLAVHSANLWLGVAQFPLCGFFPSYANDNIVADLVFLQHLTAVAHSPCRHIALLHKFEKLHLRCHDFHPILLCVFDCPWWVNGGVLVDGSVIHTCHPCKFKDAVAGLAARIGYLNRLTDLGCFLRSSLYQFDAEFDFLLQVFRHFSSSLLRNAWHPSFAKSLSKFSIPSKQG